MTDLQTRAAAIFGAGPDGVYWPYDASGIDRTLRRTDPEKYRQQLDELDRKRLVIVEWAERYGLKASTVQCCPWWLTRKVSRRCEPDKCTQYGSGATTADRSWLDHTICWNKDGKPAVITSAPYDVSADSADRIAWWVDQHPNLCSAQGSGWYGFDTTQIVLWRADRIKTVEPAGDTP